MLVLLERPIHQHVDQSDQLCILDLLPQVSRVAPYTFPWKLLPETPDELSQLMVMLERLASKQRESCYIVRPALIDDLISHLVRKRLSIMIIPRLPVVAAIAMPAAS